MVEKEKERDPPLANKFRAFIDAEELRAAKALVNALNQAMHLVIGF